MAGLVLVVDDNSGFRSLASRIFASWGHEVVEAGSVAEALVRMVERGPQAALLDISLPDGTGFDLAGELQRVDPTICVVITSSDADAAYGTAAQRVGAAFFAKDDLTSPELRQLLGDGRP